MTRRNTAACRGRKRRWTVEVIAVVATTIVVGVSVHAARHSGGDQDRGPRVPAGAQRLVSMLGVLRRPQTADDRTLPALLHGSVSRDLVRDPAAATAGRAVPQLTRLIRSLPDGRRVFLIVTTTYGRPRGPFVVDLAIVASRVRGRRTESATGASLPALSVGAGQTARQLTSDPRPYTCDVMLPHAIVPDGIARVRWTYGPRQPRPGRALTVDASVRENVAFASTRGSTECTIPRGELV